MPLKVACFGPISEAIGSVAGANLLLIRALLSAGNTIELYFVEPVVVPSDLAHNPAFSFTLLPPSWAERLGRRITRGRWNLPREALLATIYLPFRKFALRKELLSHSPPFDVLVYLGYPAYVRLERGRTISWYQGMVHAESAAIAASRAYIVRLGGWKKYLLLRSGYLLRSAAIRLFCAPSDVVVCCSTWAKDEIDRWHLRPRRIVTLPYPIDVSLFPLKTSVGDLSDPLFLWLGRIVPRKRLDLLVSAFELYRERHGQGRLLIIGGFSYLPEQIKVIENSSARELIEYRAAVPRTDIAAVFERADVLIQPSEAENFGSSVAEALAAGLPVVLGPTNGTKDYVGSAGAIFEDYSVESVYRAMVESTKPPRHTPEARKESRALAEEHFDPQRIARQLVAVIAE